MSMPNMMAYTILGSLYPGAYPLVYVGQSGSQTNFAPSTPADDTYWILILDRNNPKTKVKEFIIPGSQNSTVPAGLDAYMSNPQYLFAIVTQYLNTLHVPQGDWYDYLVKYGAGHELQRLEQINSVLSCGYFGHVSYLLTGQCGPRGAGNYPPPSYEAGSFQNMVTLLMSLMPGPNGQPPYSICDSNTFRTR